jgi:hypothetical protein
MRRYAWWQRDGNGARVNSSEPVTSAGRSDREEITMSSRANVTLPYEANDTDHLQAAQRRVQTKRWLAERERHLRLQKSPPLVPDVPAAEQRAGRLEGVGSR